MARKKAAKAEPPAKTPHPVDDLVKAEPKMDESLERRAVDARRYKQLLKIARLERRLTGGRDW